MPHFLPGVGRGTQAQRLAGRGMLPSNATYFHQGGILHFLWVY
jgi:hypothetical protein